MNNQAACDDTSNRDGGSATAAISREIADLYEKWGQLNQRANILIAGKTGTGKSTLINTVFREDLAETGIGKPVTQEIKEITKPGVPITILDTKGLELAGFEAIRNDIIGEIERRRGEDAGTYIHLAWLCIAEGSTRIEDGEIELAKSLIAMGIKVIVVITKVSRFINNEFESVVKEQFGSIAAGIVLTRGKAENIYDDEDRITGRHEVRGVDQLLDVSYVCLPETQRHAFVNATSLKHKKALDLKRSEAGSIVSFFSKAAFATGVTPIPFSDAVALAPMQIGMIIKISQVYGMKVSREAALPMVTSLVGATGASMIGRTLVSGVLKMFPGIGTVVGGTISGTTASMLTKSLGNLYADILADMAQREEKLEISNAMAALKRKLSF